MSWDSLIVIHPSKTYATINITRRLSASLMDCLFLFLIDTRLKETIMKPYRFFSEIVMATLTLKNIPDDLYNQLKDTAKLHHRSINSEILYCLERVINPHKVNVNEHLELARQLRVKTTNYLLTDEEIDKAKSEGRP